MGLVANEAPDRQLNSPPTPFTFTLPPAMVRKHAVWLRFPFISLDYRKAAFLDQSRESKKFSETITAMTPQLRAAAHSDMLDTQSNDLRGKKHDHRHFTITVIISTNLPVSPHFFPSPKFQVSLLRPPRYYGHSGPVCWVTVILRFHCIIAVTPTWVM